MKWKQTQKGHEKIVKAKQTTQRIDTSHELLFFVSPTWFQLTLGPPPMFSNTITLRLSILYHHHHLHYRLHLLQRFYGYDRCWNQVGMEKKENDIKRFESEKNAVEWCVVYVVQWRFRRQIVYIHWARAWTQMSDATDRYVSF